jgi:hypothetical protein
MFFAALLHNQLGRFIGAVALVLWVAACYLLAIYEFNLAPKIGLWCAVVLLVPDFKNIKFIFFGQQSTSASKSQQSP